MRVYLDGREVGSLQWPGAVSAGGPAAACIGSSNGGECFQGALDELRLYRSALTAEEIGQLYRNGSEALAHMARDVDAGEPQIDKPLLAHWSFNERGSAALIHNRKGSAPAEMKTATGVPRARGVYGNALSLAGAHRLATPVIPKAGEMAKISFSAWARPVDLKGYREIFRQECPQRLLFSFQNNGTILSLGLNVGGYAECDASITPAQVLDGAWHHCAATFDGEVMRVYLDGKEIGSLTRPGKIAVDTTAPGYIGSSGGRGEFFQGSLDDLRIYADALTAEQIGSLYRWWCRESLANFTRQLDKKLDAFYAANGSFAETLAAARKRLVESGTRLTPDVAGVLLARLRADFPEDYANFVNWTDGSPIEYLIAQGNDFNVKTTGRLVELALEYKPLTERQQKKQTPEQLRRWQEAEAHQRRFEELKVKGDAACFSPEWIQIILAMGRQIEFRPKVSEAVAPYITPETPPTRNPLRQRGTGDARA